MFSWTVKDEHWCNGIVVNILIPSCASEKITPQIMREQLRPFIFNVVTVDEVLPYRAVAQYISSTTQLRLRLAELLKADRVLYLDCDTIILADLGHLEDLEMHSCIAAVSMNVNVMKDVFWNGGETYDGTSCFNAGVLLMNLSRMRLEGFDDYYRKLLDKTQLNDQSVLNLFCQGNYDRLSDRYNTFPREGLTKTREEAIVLHWCSFKKPWSATCPCSEVWTFFDGLRFSSEMAPTEDQGPVVKRPPRSVFDEQQYAHYNLDLKHVKLRHHFIDRGFHERRECRDVFFDRAFTQMSYTQYVADIRCFKNASYQEWLVNFVQESQPWQDACVMVDFKSNGQSPFVTCMSEVLGSCVILSPFKNDVPKDRPGIRRVHRWEYHDDPTQLYHMLVSLKPKLIVFVGSSLTIALTAVFFPESITYSNETPDSYHPWISHNKTPDYTTSRAVSDVYLQHGYIPPLVQPPFLPPKYLSRIEEMSLSRRVSANYTTLSRLKGRGRRIVVMCGDLCGNSKPDVFQEIAQNLPEYIFVWIGGTPKEAMCFLKMKDSLANLVHLPWIQNPYWFFRNLADLLIFTSVAEPCPYVAIEALYLGLPCVTFKHATTTLQHPPLSGMHFSVDAYPSASNGTTAVRHMLSAQQQHDKDAQDKAKAYVHQHFTAVPPFMKNCL